MKHFTFIFFLLFTAHGLLPAIFFSGCGKTDSTSTGNTWTANLNVSQTGSISVGSTVYYSSTKLYVTWTSPSQTVDHYVLTATDSVQGTLVSATAASSSINATLTGLKSATTYAVNISACLDSSCTQKLTGAAAASGATPQEVWQIQGTSGTSSYSSATKVVSDGNTLPYAFRYGSGAGASIEGKLQLYYNPSGQTEKGTKIAITSSAATTSVSSVSSFTAFSGVGLVNPPVGSPFIFKVNASQTVPLSSSMGSKIRLFFEATGSDNKTRIMYLDSQDSYVGQDFNSGSSTQCSSQADYSAGGGGCAPTVAIGVEGDLTNANTNLSNARQFKIGFPQLSDWRWDGADGTFMIFTANPTVLCTSVDKNQGYAVWDGTSKWVVQYSGSCPKVFSNMQAPMPVHLGGLKYKLYYSDTTKADTSTSIPSPGPKKILYADGIASGSASTVDYEDWESMTSARDIVVIWPSGTQLTDSEESHLDDYVVVAPTGDLSFQVMYSNMTDGSIVPFTGMLVLMNP